MVENCDNCGKFTGEDDGDWTFCDDCWYVRLHRYGPQWAQIRQDAVQRDNYRCQSCGLSQAESREKYGERLHVHHKIPYDDGGTHDLSNLVTLCKGCHSRRELRSRRDK